MKSQHTPGPWMATYRAECGPGTQLTEWAIWPQKSGEARICSLVDGSKAEANARLIAALPELLAALESCFAMLTSPKFSGWMDANCADDELWAMTQAMIQRRDEARAALAKAKGDA